MQFDDVYQLAELIRERNEVSARITRLIGRPALAGHVGEWIASRVFDIELQESAIAMGFDGTFRSGPLIHRSVNIKFYAKHERLLDIREDALPEYFLVLAGPRRRTISSRGEVRPWLVDSVFLFDSASLLNQLRRRRIGIGLATSVVDHLWNSAEIYPTASNAALLLDESQRRQLRQFSSLHAS